MNTLGKLVRKAVIPAAGFGTRFLPQTKAMPKEMLPIVDKPVIQYVVEGLVQAGIEDIIIVTGYHKRNIEDHFDAPNQELIDNLKMGGEKKRVMLEEVMAISTMANFIYVRQKGPYGNGTPLLNVKHLIGDEPFIYTWSDDMIVGEPNEFEQLVNVYVKYGKSVLAGVRADQDDDYKRYGYVGGREIEPGIYDAVDIIEKPGREKAPSSLATVSSFLFTPDIFDYLDEALAKMPEGGELFYNDALKLMRQDGKQILAAEITNSQYFDTGNKLDYLKTVVTFGIRNKRIGKEFSEWLKLNGIE